ncbi:MAG: MBL fold metallo-hydrolase [Pikeienuella sp.]
MKIRVKFWGTRGSLPTSFTQNQLDAAVGRALAAAGPEHVGSAEAAADFLKSDAARALPRRFGGETTSVEISNAGGGRVLIDLGTGSRVFANDAMRQHGPVSEKPYSILLSHLHWDHIQGFPFFAPAFIPGNTLRIGGGHGGEAIKSALLGEFQQPFFPVPAEFLKSQMSFFDCAPGEAFELEGFQVTPLLLSHGGGSYGYRLDYDGVSVVFASDAEHKYEDLHEDYDYVKWIAGTDLLIFDAQYALTDLVLHKEDWGHSSGMLAVDLAHLGSVKRVAMVHHDPAADDDMLTQMEAETLEYLAMLREGGAPDVEISAAIDGQVVELG